MDYERRKIIRRAAYKSRRDNRRVVSRRWGFLKVVKNPIAYLATGAPAFSYLYRRPDAD